MPSVVSCRSLHCQRAADQTKAFHKSRKRTALRPVSQQTGAFIKKRPARLFTGRAPDIVGKCKEKAPRRFPLLPAAKAVVGHAVSTAAFGIVSFTPRPPGPAEQLPRLHRAASYDESQNGSPVICTRKPSPAPQNMYL